MACIRGRLGEMRCGNVRMKDHYAGQLSTALPSLVDRV